MIPILQALIPGKYDVDLVSEHTGLECDDPSLAQQHQKEESDINTIVRRFGVTGMLPQGIHPPTFADFEDVFDFQSAQNAIVAANAAFMALPADVRYRFHNDPQQFVEFCSDPENLDEMRELGLAVPLKEPEPDKVQKVEIVNPPADSED